MYYYSNQQSKFLKYEMSTGLYGRARTMFVMNINYLPFCIKHCKAILFADDTTIYNTGKQIKIYMKI